MPREEAGDARTLSPSSRSREGSSAAKEGKESFGLNSFFFAIFQKWNFSGTAAVSAKLAYSFWVWFLRAVGSLLTGGTTQPGSVQAVT